MDNKYAIIGDIHDNYDKLIELLDRLGLKVSDCKPQNEIDRQIIFVGDLIDRGDKPVEVLKLVMNMVHSGKAQMVIGNHDYKLYRGIKGNNIKINDELKITMEKIYKEDSDFVDKVKDFLSSLPYYLSLDDDSLYIVHGAAPEELQKKSSDKARSRALYGVTTGKFIDGFPERIDWGSTYTGRRYVVYGHQIIDTPKWVNKTIDIDTGCFRTGILSAVLWPEKEIISVGR